MNTWLQRKHILTAPVTNSAGIFVTHSCSGHVYFGGSSSTLKIDNNGSACGQFIIADSFSECLRIDENGLGRIQIKNIDDRPILEKLIFPERSLAHHAQIEKRARLHGKQEKRRKRKIKNVRDHYERSGVYLLYDDDYEVVYVGQSVRPFARISQHLKSKKFSHFRILWCLDSRKLHWEKVLTRYFDPKLNKTNRPDYYRHA